MPRERLILLVSVAGAAVVLFVVGAYAYDNSRNDLVVKGVKVAGVDVGGMRANAARHKLSAQLTSALERPVRVSVAGQRFRLSPKTASLAADVDGMVDDALSRSRSGGLPGRVWRDLTGSDVNAELPARVTYSAIAVRRFVRHVKRVVDRPARDASVKFATADLPAVPSQKGIKVSYRRLLRVVSGGLNATGSARSVRVRAKVTQPKVTTAQLARKYPVVLTIDRPGFRLRLFKSLRFVKAYSIAVGRAGLETPAGLYHITDKQVNPSWHVPNSAWAGALAGRVIPPGPDDPIKARWMGVAAGAGIHGTDDIGSLGTAASHGCIRMSIPDVEQLYDQVPYQTPVFIQ